MSFVRFVAALVIVVFATGAEAQAPAPKRVALIIANSAYAQQSVLANPARDAQAVRAALQRAGFAADILANRTKAQMEADLNAFRRRADAAEIALIYFAGHGMRVGQTNWLLPTDFDSSGIANEEDFESYAIAHRTILRQLGAAPTRIAVFDACRDNPYEAAIAARMNLAARSASVPRTRNPVAPQPGLAPIEADNVLILFSAAAGQFASDGVEGQPSPFARAFADTITTQTELRIVAGAIRDKVIASTGGEASRTAQRPYLSGSLGGREVYLMGAPVRTAPIGEEAAAFARCNTNWTVACWRDYVARFPDGNNVRTARIVLASLETPAAVTSDPSGLQAVEAVRRSLSAMPDADWSRGDENVLAARLIATHGRQNLERAAHLGDSRAQWIVGRAYGLGLGGFPDDDVRGARWYKTSAADGFALAQVSLGAEYAAGTSGVAKSDEEAVRLFRLAAEQGSAHGQANLGYMYRQGRGGLAKDEQEAVRLYRLAALQGNALGQANLGVMYDLGLGGLARDEREALRLFRLAADQGNPTGQANLALLYMQGRGGLQQDRAEAVRLFRLAARQGNQFAVQSLRQLGETW